MPSVDPAPVKLDYDHFLSAEAKGRVRSQLRALGPYHSIPGMISFGGGLPHPSTWPVNAITLSVPFANKSVFVPGYQGEDPSKLYPLAPFTPTTKLSLQSDPLDPNLTRDLQYSATFGLQYFVDWITEHVKRIHNPPYPEADWQVHCTAGNTDGFDGVARTLLNRGEYVLVEEFAFPATINHYASLGGRNIGVPLDGEGLDAEALNKILSEWDEEERGGARPKTLLVVPTCSNPTGVTYTVPRKKEIYTVARKWNLLVIEDDPYCYLQSRPDGYDTPLVPSFLSLDVDGRVVRIDSFSKFIAPGSRAGWITGPKDIVTAIMRKGESSSNGPSGFAIASIAGIIQAWGSHEGLEKEYLPHISAVYNSRASDMVRHIRKYVSPETLETPEPTGGMFLWVRLRLENHPLLGKVDPEEISARTFKRLVDEKVLTVPSQYFKAGGGIELSKEEEAKRIFLRLSFATADPEQMEEGVKRLAKGLREEWELKE
ncbi:aromatic amino acid aminotransferase I [Cryptococcus wingfieldii CBS 7118]|uniref:Aromatic amino acid aminotransferase I n=1 Tax=Cryptococcus wingfieldii CBS 7118 TaxID=1295528 RepID=A0A1E3JCB6_9TREE|nr:aromatic amino acid aminotransferase I [Cryptococcus wingfieldii CBS 7118]ODN98484.1 aromatic amino acid aminotransferase I [Cryptococcus wingfieldii CBS 7118]